MGLPVQSQLKYWGIASAVFLVALWYIGNVMMPFLLGGAIAYFLDPVADRLENAGLSRTAATVTISLGAVFVLMVIILTIIPLLINQAISLVETAPQLFTQLEEFLSSKFPGIMDADGPISQALGKIGETIQSRGGEILQAVLSSAQSVVNIVLPLVIAPVVAFYLLLDWDRMVAQVDRLLPRDHAPTIRSIATQIDRTLAAFVRGQSTVCLVLGTFYAVALMLVGLNFGIVAGFIAGLLTFIPYIGALVGGLLAIGLALFQFWGDWWSIGIVAAIFAVGQVLEGNVITPKLVGKSVGLHPVWLIFALSAFGTLYGFVGMLVAVPVAASIGVVVRFAITQYEDSLLYQGRERYAATHPEDTDANPDTE
ncbi:AI-2E family transporter [Halocynthiibacter namhaensis]|uniref:AI-2E family transporter n=1 Tax=Halocynthiibacter namhaensis TaxID=1290553 RepID=UPI0005797FA8|nr:AI-2E family transporter [Halocynthiibacter namhaensis]